MRKLIYKVVQRLYFAGLMPWRVWSAVYDRWHRLFDIESKYARGFKRV